MHKNGKQLIDISVLSNGIQLVTERLPYLRSAAFSIWIKAGSKYETEKLNGISHFIEHLIFKGTEDLKARDISLKVDEMGGSVNAFTNRQEISFYIKVLDSELENGIDLISDIVRGPAFREEDIEVERKVILEEIRMYEDSPDEAAGDYFLKSFWDNHPLGRPVQGTIESVSALTRQDIMDYYREALVPERIVIAAAGMLEHEELAAFLEKKFSFLPKSDFKENLTTPQPTEFKDIIQRPQLEQVRFIMGREGVTLSDPDRHATQLLSTLLGGNSSSRLFQKAREEQGLVYDISAASLAYHDTGVFAVSAGTAPGTLDHLLDVIKEELTELVTSPITEEEVQRLKNFVKGNMMLALEDSSARMNRLARYALHYDRYYTLDEILEKVDSVTAEKMSELARKIFPGKWSLTLIGPKQKYNIPDTKLEINV